MFFGAAIGSKNYARQEYRAALKHGIRNPETETETETEYGIRNQISMIEN